MKHLLVIFLIAGLACLTLPSAFAQGSGGDPTTALTAPHGAPGVLPMVPGDVLAGPVPLLGGAPLGTCYIPDTTHGVEAILVVDLFSGTTDVYDAVLLTPLATIPNPAGPATTTGVSYDGVGLLWAVPGAGGTLYTTDPFGGGAVAVGPLAVPGGGLVGGIAMSPGGLWADDIVSDQYSLHDPTTGAALGPVVGHPDGGGFGNGVAFRGDCGFLEIAHGTGGAGQVTTISTADPATGNAFAGIDVTALGTFVNGIESSFPFAPGLTDPFGVYSMWVVENASNTLYVIEGNPACPTPPLPPANDDCLSATPVSEGDHAYTNIAATDDGPPAGVPIGSDVWFLYTATETATTVCSLCAITDYDAAMAAYDAAIGCPPPDGSHIAVDDDGCGIGGGPSVFTFDATAGQDYLIQVGGWQGAQGTGQLSIFQVTDCHDPINGGYTVAFTDFPNQSSPNAPISSTLPPVVDTITVATSDIIADVNVALDISHTFLGDLDIDLTHDVSATSMFLYNQGDSSDLDGVYVLDDEAVESLFDAAAAIVGGTVPPGTYQPSELLSIFDGLDTQSGWTMSITDTFGGDDGTLRAWELIFNDTPNQIGIPDNDPTGAIVAITVDASNTDAIGDLDVQLDITHTWIGDLEIDLMSPAGTVVRLHDGTGGSADDINTRYDDAAGFNDGVYTPPDGPGVLADFDGEDVAGMWSLTMVDTAGGDTGTLDNWELLFCAAECLPPLDLTCASDCLTGDITLGWTNAQVYAGIEIRRDGAPIATLAGDATSYVDTGVPDGTYAYDVVVDCAPGGNAASCSVSHSAYNGATDAILALEGLQSGGDVGDIDSAAAVEPALLNNGRTVQVLTNILGSECILSQVDNAWVLNGSYPDDYRHSLEELEALAALSEAGLNIVFTAGDHWGFAHVTSSLDGRDGVEDGTAGDGDDTFTAMDGLDAGPGVGIDMSAFQDVPYTQDQTGNDWTDQLNVATADAAGPNAGGIFRLDEALGTPYTTGIAYNTDSGGKFISQSWELGGFDTADPTQLDALVDAFLIFFGGIVLPGFERGNCNVNDGYQIGDAIFLLGHILPPNLNTPECMDSCDANDDGALDIGDAISMFSSLFPPNTPLPDPYLVCGTDPTDDPPGSGGDLGCVNYPSCP